ncbi:MAG: bifunctional 2-C-methyl-D-erythritol 4-phosphate cytidylyltransferase/2-C-methyl-D-erythritol 2,4-cyclodiphosphate synthase [Methylobacterium mesophilicum]|nr:bifunctional 2-C-methyl-D-erythritol 4-phosphate cytidylyltransferase/2-C-methyl-D-erythritol 2,4-cyclodiphosphate synthase [Methylobacterium mesophilicum]
MTLQDKERVAVVVVAAGRGERAGKAEGPKQYRKLGDRTVIARSLDRFRQHSGIGPIVVVVHADDTELLSAACDVEGLRVVIGGSTRQASVLRGLEALEDDAPAKVLIHDAVRPFVDAETVDRVIEAVDEEAGALAASPMPDTLKREAADGTVLETLPRQGLWAAQTPQGFPFASILEAHRKADMEGRHDFTDDAAIAEWAGLPVRLVEGSAENAKLTWTRDIERARAMISAQPRFPDVRAGTGYDVHAFEPGEEVWLCGVAIPFNRKLSGHSDADAPLHALTDALLATCGAGDIGTHFPPSDPQWKGVASRRFVEHAAKIVREAGGRIANADITIVAEAPKVGPHREAMTALLGEMLGIAPNRISVKATTNERMGFVGREEGIAAFATVSVVYPGELE